MKYLAIIHWSQKHNQRNCKTILRLFDKTMKGFNRKVRSGTDGIWTHDLLFTSQAL